MADSVTCDRCGSATDATRYHSALRADVKIAHLSKAATMNTRKELDLCEPCTEALHAWLGEDLPRKYREDNGYE